MTDEIALATSRKRRGVVHASLTCLVGRLSDLEAKHERSQADCLAAQQLASRLSSLDTDFKTHRYANVDILPEEALEAEQAILDEHDDRITDLTVRLGQLVAEPDSSSHSRTASGPGSHLTKKLAHVEKSIQAVTETVEPLRSGSPMGESVKCGIRNNGIAE